jgi:hypothetical protein
MTADGGQATLPGAPGSEPESLLVTMKRAAAALKRAGIAFALAGGAAAYARGAAPSAHDVDFVICGPDCDAAAKTLAGEGMRIEQPPEDWLVKAYDGANLVDLIFVLGGRPVTPGLLERAEEMDVASLRMPVLSATDLLISWLMSMTEHHADFAGTLTSVRPLREQVDWDTVRAETAGSPFAAAFLFLLERLRVLDAGQERP